MGDREDHGDRLELGDHDDAVGVAGLDHVALIDLPEPNASADRCDDVAIGDLELGICNKRPIDVDQGLGLLVNGLELVSLLLREGSSGWQVPGSIDVETSQLQGG